MSETTNNQEIPQEGPEMTPAQMAEFRKKATEYYKNQTGVLKAQLEYESLLADIEEARTKRMTMTIRMAQMMAGPQEEPSDEEKAEMMQQMQEKIQSEGEESAKTSRQLKKDKA